MAQKRAGQARPLATVEPFKGVLSADKLAREIFERYSPERGYPWTFASLVFLLKNNRAVRERPWDSVLHSKYFGILQFHLTLWKNRRIQLEGGRGAAHFERGPEKGNLVEKNKTPVQPLASWSPFRSREFNGESTITSGLRFLPIPVYLERGGAGVQGPLGPAGVLRRSSEGFGEAFDQSRSLLLRELWNRKEEEPAEGIQQLRWNPKTEGIRPPSGSWPEKPQPESKAGSQLQREKHERKLRLPLPRFDSQTQTAAMWWPRLQDQSRRQPGLDLWQFWPQLVLLRQPEVSLRSQTSSSPLWPQPGAHLWPPRQPQTNLSQLQSPYPQLKPYPIWPKLRPQDRSLILSRIQTREERFWKIDAEGPGRFGAASTLVTKSAFDLLAQQVWFERRQLGQERGSFPAGQPPAALPGSLVPAGEPRQRRESSADWSRVLSLWKPQSRREEESAEGLQRLRSNSKTEGILPQSPLQPRPEKPQSGSMAGPQLQLVSQTPIAPMPWSQAQFQRKPQMSVVALRPQPQQKLVYIGPQLKLWRRTRLSSRMEAQEERPLTREGHRQWDLALTLVAKPAFHLFKADTIRPGKSGRGATEPRDTRSAATDPGTAEPIAARLGSVWRRAVGMGADLFPSKGVRQKEKRLAGLALQLAAEIGGLEGLDGPLGQTQSLLLWKSRNHREEEPAMGLWQLRSNPKAGTQSLSPWSPWSEKPKSEPKAGPQLWNEKHEISLKVRSQSQPGPQTRPQLDSYPQPRSLPWLLSQLQFRRQTVPNLRQPYPGQLSHPQELSYPRQRLSQPPQQHLHQRTQIPRQSQMNLSQLQSHLQREPIQIWRQLKSPNRARLSLQPQVRSSEAADRVRGGGQAMLEYQRTESLVHTAPASRESRQELSEGNDWKNVEEIQKLETIVKKHEQLIAQDKGLVEELTKKVESQAQHIDRMIQERERASGKKKAGQAKMSRDMMNQFRAELRMERMRLGIE